MVYRVSYKRIVMRPNSRTGYLCDAKVFNSFPQTYWQLKHQFVQAAGGLPGSAVYYADTCPEASL